MEIFIENKSLEAFVDEKRRWVKENNEKSNEITESTNSNVNGQKKLKIDEKLLANKNNSDPRGFKLSSKIEMETDIKKIFEERLLDSEVTFTWHEILAVAKKDFHELIIEIRLPNDVNVSSIMDDFITTSEKEFLKDARFVFRNSFDDIGTQKPPLSHYSILFRARATSLKR